MKLGALRDEKRSKFIQEVRKMELLTSCAILPPSL